MLVLCTLAVINSLWSGVLCFRSKRKENAQSQVSKEDHCIEGVNGGDGNRERELKEGSFIPLPFSLSASLPV